MCQPADGLEGGRGFFSAGRLTLKRKGQKEELGRKGMFSGSLEKRTAVSTASLTSGWSGGRVSGYRLRQDRR